MVARVAPDRTDEGLPSSAMLQRMAGTGRFRLIVGVHDLSPTPDARDDELLSWLPFSEVAPLLGQVLDNSRSTGAVLHITSDDGFRSDHELLLPWLLEHRVDATFFIPTRYIGLPGRLTVAQIREIAALGIRIGVHGARHINWAQVPEPEFLADMHEGLDTLQQLLGKAVDTVAPPFGGYNGHVVAHLLQQGFREIHTCRPGIALASGPLMPRNMIKKGNTDSVLATSMRPGGFTDIARCRLRHVRASLSRLAGTA